MHGDGDISWWWAKTVMMTVWRPWWQCGGFKLTCLVSHVAAISTATQTPRTRHWPRLSIPSVSWRRTSFRSPCLATPGLPWVAPLWPTSSSPRCGVVVGDDDVGFVGDMVVVVGDCDVIWSIICISWYTLRTTFVRARKSKMLEPQLFPEVKVMLVVVLGKVLCFQDFYISFCTVESVVVPTF